MENQKVEYVTENSINPLRSSSLNSYAEKGYVLKFFEVIRNPDSYTYPMSFNYIFEREVEQK